jgi:hypothetical protein
VDNAVRHREHRRHENQEVQGAFIMPRREEGLDVGGTETRRAQRELPGIDHSGSEGLGHLGRVDILEELRQEPCREPKSGGKGGVFTLTVVTAMQGGDIGGQQLPFPSGEGRVPPHDGLVELREWDPDRWFAGKGVLHVRVWHGREEGHRVTPLKGTI